MNISANLFSVLHVKRLVACVITCGIFLVLPACQIPQLRQSELGVGLPTTYNGASSSENSAQLRVEDFYNDPTLTQLICQSVAGNRELKVLEEEVQIARNEILARRGAYLPFVGFRGTIGGDRPSLFTPAGAAEDQLLTPSGKFFPDPLANYLASFNLLWQIDIWRELRNARDAATQRYLAAIERRNYFITRLVADVSENYYALMALDQRLLNLDRIIAFQQRSLEMARARFDAGRGSELGVQRFLAEVRKNQSEKLIVTQEIVETENRINFLAGRFPQHVERMSAGFFDLNINTLQIGVPAQLLQNRPDIRQAERELAASGLDIMVARAHFFPRLDISAGIGYQGFNPKYLFNPEALIASAAGDLAAPVINRAAIRADYLTANAKQLESVYNYQRVVINAFTEVINRISMVENYRRSIEIKKQQLTALEASVDAANKLFLAARIEYIDVLFAQRDLLEARRVLIDTKQQQLTAIVNAYQALGGGYMMSCLPQEKQPNAPPVPRIPEAQSLPSPRKAVDAPMPPRLPDTLPMFPLRK